MKIIWTHIAKNGGHYIKEIAKKEYKKGYFLVTSKTSKEELERHLNLPNVFIAVNHYETRPDILHLLITAEANRILITRNPIDRFCSFVRHATVTKGPFLTKDGARLWNQEYFINQPLSPSNWLNACLERINMELSSKSEIPIPIVINSGLTYFALSQLWEAFFKMNYVISEEKLIYSNNPVEHLINLRKCASLNNQSIIQYIKFFIDKFYYQYGSLSENDNLMHSLAIKGVFKQAYKKSDVKDINSYANHISCNIDGNIASSYFGIVQEEFVLNFLCTKNIQFY